ncbi:MAG: hypothetical protein ABEK84_05840 [Salinibacter sp.]
MNSLRAASRAASWSSDARACSWSHVSIDFAERLSSSRRCSTS